MRIYIIYLFLTGKRLLRQMPYLLAGVAVMMLLIGTAAFSASQLLYGGKSLSKIEVGVVLPEDDSLSEKVTKMIASLDSVESLCSFKYLNKYEAFEKVKKGELQAVLEVPSGMAGGILDGTNQPATIWLADESGIEGAVFRELSEAGSSVLGTSQAAIYAADEFLENHGFSNQIFTSERDLNRIFLKYAMNREALYKNKTVSAAGNVSTAVFYGISGIVFLMLLTGIPAAGFLSPHETTLEQGLDRIGIGRSYQLFCKLLWMTVLLMAVTGAGYIYAARNGYALLGNKELIVWCLICLVISAWNMVIYEACKNEAAAIVALFVINTVLIFMAGGIIPSIFLPEAIQKIGKITLTTLLIDGVRFIASGEDAGTISIFLKLSILAFVFYIAAVLVGKRRS